MNLIKPKEKFKVKESCYFNDSKTFIDINVSQINI